MRNNKAFQTIVGAFVVLTLFRLYREGWFDALMQTPDDGGQVESVDLIAMVITAALSALQMCGLFAIGIVAGLLPVLQSLFDGAMNLIRPKTNDAGDQGVDAATLNQVLTDLQDRLKALEKSDDG